MKETKTRRKRLKDEDGENKKNNASRFRVSRTIADDGMSYLPLAAARAGARLNREGIKLRDLTTRSREVVEV